VRIALALALVTSVACSHVSTVRLSPDSVEAGPNRRPIAGIQANAISFYFLFVPVPGVDLDRTVNQMLIATAKTMGADKIANLRFEIDPDGGIWALRKLLGWRSSRASGVAVQVTAPPEDANAFDGPEPYAAPAEPPETGAEGPPPAAKQPPEGTRPQEDVPEVPAQPEQR